MAHPPGGRSVHIVLVEPRIPPNTGNIARLCAALGYPLHLLGRLGFSLEDRHLRRAGLDYWKFVDLRLHPDVESFLAGIDTGRLHFFSKRARRTHWDATYREGDYLVFGNEEAGLPATIHATYPERFRKLAMRNSGVRSLNLSSAVAAAAYEAARQLGE